ncbi:MAG: hypothetical protein RLZ22_152 [Verrucomicrobiota bacterium]|jgi:hypothetical protein
MPNTFDSALVADSIAQQAQTVLANRLSALNLFASDFSSDVKKAKDTVQVPLVTATGATVVNPTNFEPGGSATVGKASVTLDHIFQPFAITASELASGHRLERLIRISLDALADKIWALATAPITVANFGAAAVTKAATGITPTSGDIAKVWAAVSKSPRKGLVVNPTIYSQLIPTSTTGLSLGQGAYGFDNGVHYATQFSGETNMIGFGCAPEALVMAAAAPAIDDAVRAQFAVSDIVTLDQLGLSVQYNVWGSTANRQVNASLEVMFGAAAGITDGTMAIIKSAA